MGSDHSLPPLSLPSSCHVLLSLLIQFLSHLLQRAHLCYSVTYDCKCQLIQTDLPLSSREEGQSKKTAKEGTTRTEDQRASRRFYGVMKCPRLVPYLRGLQAPHPRSTTPASPNTGDMACQVAAGHSLGRAVSGTQLAPSGMLNSRSYPNASQRQT